MEQKPEFVRKLAVGLGWFPPTGFFGLGQFIVDGRSTRLGWWQLIVGVLLFAVAVTWGHEYGFALGESNVDTLLNFGTRIRTKSDAIFLVVLALLSSLLGFIGFILWLAGGLKLSKRLKKK